MAMKYDESSARMRLRDNGISTDGKVIEISRGNNVGIRLWGAIDFLCNYCGFSWRKTK
jgi:hypothetical protein